MRIIDPELVASIKWNGDSKAYDQQLSELCKDGQHFIIINPELKGDVLSLINVDIPLNDNCIKYKSGEGWIAKRFPPNWNGRTQIIQLNVKPVRSIINNFVDWDSPSLINYSPNAWDLKYTNIWVYDHSLTGGKDVDAVIYEYIPTSQGRKIIGKINTLDIPKKHDVFFLSYKEKDAEDNWHRLQFICPDAKRINGVKGILNAHMAAANSSTTDMFYVVDADAYIVDDFKFDFVPYIQDRRHVHIWHSINPINDLEYGYGGVKLFPKCGLLDNKKNLIDVSTSLGDVRVIEKLACETKFNTDPFNTWKSAFRECAKLSSKIIKNQKNTETTYRLEQWINKGSNKLFGEYSIAGAIAGKEFGENTTDLFLINNFEWLQKKFLKHYPQVNIRL
jgi:hypothetical protein